MLGAYMGRYYIEAVFPDRFGIHHPPTVPAALGKTAGTRTVLLQPEDIHRVIHRC